MKKHSSNLKLSSLLKFKVTVSKIAQCCVGLWDKYIFGGMYFDPVLPYVSSLGQWIYLSILLKKDIYTEDYENRGGQPSPHP